MTYFVNTLDSNTLILLALNAGVLALFSYLLFHFFAKKTIGRDTAYIKDQAYKEAMKIVETAQLKSYATLQESAEQAKKIIAAATSLTTSKKTELTAQIDALFQTHLTSLQELSAKMTASFLATLAEQKDQNLAVIQKTAQRVEGELITSIGDFKQLLEKETFKSEEAIRAKVDQVYTQVLAELTEYKQKRLESVDKNINAIIAQTAVELFGETMDLTTRQDLVFKALDKAKHEHLFEV